MINSGCFPSGIDQDDGKDHTGDAEGFPDAPYFAEYQYTDHSGDDGFNGSDHRNPGQFQVSRQTVEVEQVRADSWDQSVSECVEPEGGAADFCDLSPGMYEDRQEQRAEQKPIKGSCHGVNIPGCNAADDRHQAVEESGQDTEQHAGCGNIHSGEISVRYHECAGDDIDQDCRNFPNRYFFMKNDD